MPLPIDQSQTVSAMARGRFTSEVGWAAIRVVARGDDPDPVADEDEEEQRQCEGTNSRPAGPMTESVRSWIWSTTVS